MAKNSTALSQLFAVFLISNTIYRVIGNVYRSECRRDALLVATDRDKVVSQTVGGVLQTIKNIRLPLCAKQCTGNNQCQSLNFKKAATSECEILSFNKTSAGAVIENKPGWIHYEPINQTGPRCRLVDCEPGYQCVERCSILSGYECIDIDECQSGPCQNGGACSNLVNKYTCTCVPGYTGINCETDINECQSVPCQNDGTCYNLVNKYNCSCVPGYTGLNCETDINECQSSPCQNGGTCTNLVNKYSCSCAAGYVGTNCESDVNECGSSPCQNGGTCNNLVNQYTCTCTAEYTGTNCQTLFTACDSYTTLTSADRNINYIDGTTSCDNSLTLGWYRFMGSAGTMMYTSCPPGYGTDFRCQTHGGGWLNGAHPSTSEGIVERTVCFAWSGCCGLSNVIRVKNCGSYYVYELKPAPSCNYRYCSYN